MWSSLPIFRDIVRDSYSRNVEHNATTALPEACCANPLRDDAFATIVQWLSYRAHGKADVPVSAEE